MHVADVDEAGDGRNTHGKVTATGALTAAEQLVSSLQGKLGDPATYAGGGNVVAVQRELEAARAEAERLTARWEELEVKRSSAT